MTRAIGRALFVFMSMTVGAMLMLFAPLLYQYGLDEYDRLNPVWHPKSAQIIARDGDTVTVHVIGTKTRECALRRTWAQVYYSGAASTDAIVVRQGSNVSALGTVSRPVGVHDLGNLIIAPVTAEADRVVVRVEHECARRLVTSVLAEVML